MSQTKIHSQNTQQKCRLVLGFDIDTEISDDRLLELARASDLAALILYSGKGDESQLQKRAMALAHPVQAEQVALLIAGDPRIARRVSADGVHDEIGDGFVSCSHQGKENLMIGYGHIKDRHQAMLLGEAGADYLMFGKLGADKQPQPHPRNLRLAHWCAEIIQIPCLVQAGSDMDALPMLVATGAEFIMMEEMILAQTDPVDALIKVNDWLDKNIILRQEGIK